MSNGQNQEVAPATLPADFFKPKKTPVAGGVEAPATLPKDFFQQKPQKAQQPPVAAAAAVPPPETAHTEHQRKEAAGEYDSPFLRQDAGYQALKRFSQKPTPNWAMPGAYLNDPHWYGRSARYFGGELYGASQAGAGVITGGWKMLNDLASAMNPFEAEGKYGEKKLGTFLGDVGKTSEGVVDTSKDIGKIAWDLIRMHPETHSDPAHFGQTISNAAMVVDGGVKGAKSFAEMLKTDPAEAARVAAKASNGVPSRFFRRKAFEDTYVHAKGLEIAKKVNKASKAISEEAASHANNISSQIDTKIPTGVIDAGAEASTIIKEFKEVVKTPEAAHPVLRQMLKDAQATAPGQWTWEKARQFRSSIGRAMGKVEGPQRVVLTKIYKDLTNKLGSTAKQYGLEDSWNHYNELERKTSHQFADLIDDVNNAQSGKEVAQKLGRDTALTSEMIHNLGKYGLDYSETMKFLKDAKRIADSQGKWKGTLFRMAYGTPAGVPAMLAVRGAGGGWMPSVLAGALTGYGFTHIINMARAAKLSPTVIDLILKERELPGRMPLGKGTFPEEGSPQLPAPKPETPGGGGGEGETPLDQALRLRGAESVETPAEKAVREHRESPEGKKEETSRKMIKEGGKPPSFERAEDKAKAAAKAKPEEVGREPGAKPGTTRESAIGRRTKARERVAKKREEVGRTRQKETDDAMARSQAQDLDVLQIQIPDLEEALKAMEPEAYNALQKARKLKKFDEVDYEPYLREMVLRAYEKLGPK